MKHNAVLSSEQALDEYFSALLDEDAEELELAQETNKEVATEISQERELVPQLKPTSRPYSQVQPAEALPSVNLDKVQRLLNQLESEPVAQVEQAEVLIEQNTAELTHSDTVDTSLATESQLEMTTEVADEVQDWDVTQAAVDTMDEDVDTEQHTVVESVASPDSTIAPASADTLAVTNDGIPAETWHSVQRDTDFQVLYFDVNGVSFAVPLDELGGIHRVESLNHIIGKPRWYLGLQTNRDLQLDVVDTARWVMADKLTDDSHKEAYQYIVMLGDSNWGLAAGALRGTELLNKDKVRWREHVGKRPWLAGMVKEKMCALIHVEALVKMLNAGLDVKALDNDK